MASLNGVSIGGLLVGGGAPVRVESMLKTPLEDLEGCLRELEGLVAEGCELVRTSYRDAGLEGCLRELVSGSSIPIMADIHFDHRLALSAMDAGCQAIRVNPGNLGGRDNLLTVLRRAMDLGVVIRVGANGGSLNNHQLAQSGGDRAAALVAAVREQVDLCLEMGFDRVVVSAKSSSVPETVRANQILASMYQLPFHVGITEAGPLEEGAIKSAVGIGIMLSAGIGDTVRVSLSSEGVHEVRTAYRILGALGLRHRGIEWISCPTCGRCRLDVKVYVDRVRAVMDRFKGIPDGFTVAVMGCEVNGPREAASAKLGVAGSTSGFVVFVEGRPIGNWPLDKLEEVLSKVAKDLVPGAEER